MHLERHTDVCNRIFLLIFLYFDVPFLGAFLRTWYILQSPEFSPLLPPCINFTKMFLKLRTGQVIGSVMENLPTVRKAPRLANHRGVWAIPYTVRLEGVYSRWFHSLTKAAKPVIYWQQGVEYLPQVPHFEPLSCFYGCNCLLYGSLY